MNPSNGSCVYIVHAIETPFYKIGMTTRIKSRLASFRAVAPFIEFDPVLIYYHEDRKKIEKQLHKRFQEQRIAGTEWFKLDEINFEYLRQDIDVIANALDRQKRTNEIYPVSNQKNKPKQSKPKHKPDPVEHKAKVIIESVRWEGWIPFNELSDSMYEFEYGFLPQVWYVYAHLDDWKEVAKIYDMDPVELWKIANWQWEPMDNKTRKKLGLCLFIPPEGGGDLSDEEILKIIVNKS